MDDNEIEEEEEEEEEEYESEPEDWPGVWAIRDAMSAGCLPVVVANHLPAIASASPHPAQRPPLTSVHGSLAASIQEAMLRQSPAGSSSPRSNASGSFGQLL